MKPEEGQRRRQDKAAFHETQREKRRPHSLHKRSGVKRDATEHSFNKASFSQTSFTQRASTSKANFGNLERPEEKILRKPNACLEAWEENREGLTIKQMIDTNVLNR
jgi:hypothetical protein